MATYSSVECFEEYLTIKEQITLTNHSRQVTLRCAWEDRFALVQDILGNNKVYPHGGFAAQPTAISASIMPAPTSFGATGQSIEYIDALVTITYGVRDGARDDGPGGGNPEDRELYSESLEPTADFITLDHKRFRWGAANGDPLQENEAPGKLRRSLSLVRTIYNHAGSLPGALLSDVGKVNPTAYNSNSLGLSFGEETLLFTPPQMSRTITTSGTEGWTINMKFMFKPEGWNKFWKAESESYESIFILGGGEYKSYEPGSFAGLLG